MSSLIYELVNMASTPGVSTADLLRRALVVARRLSVPEVVGWINSELMGYRDARGDAPDYRRLRGQLKVRNPYHGWIPFHVPSDMAEMVTDFSAGQSIPELQRLMANDSDLICPFPAEMEQILMSMMKRSSGITLQPALMISPVQVEGIIETVRSRVLEWALDLESKGIIGEGMTFTMEEKQVVQAQHYHFGDVSGSQIQIASSGSTQSQLQGASTNDIEALRRLIQALSEVLDSGVASADVTEELQAELATLRAQAASPKPKWEVIRMTARAIKTVTEGAASNILSELAKPHVQTLLALAGASIGSGL